MGCDGYFHCVLRRPAHVFVLNHSLAGFVMSARAAVQSFRGQQMTFSTQPRHYRTALDYEQAVFCRRYPPTARRSQLSFVGVKFSKFSLRYQRSLPKNDNQHPTNPCDNTPAQIQKSSQSVPGSDDGPLIFLFHFFLKASGWSVAFFNSSEFTSLRPVVISSKGEH